MAVVVEEELLKVPPDIIWIEGGIEQTFFLFEFFARWTTPAFQVFIDWILFFTIYLIKDHFFKKMYVLIQKVYAF